MGERGREDGSAWGGAVAEGFSKRGGLRVEAGVGLRGGDSSKQAEGEDAVQSRRRMAEWGG